MTDEEINQQLDHSTICFCGEYKRLGFPLCESCRYAILHSPDGSRIYLGLFKYETPQFYAAYREATAYLKQIGRIAGEFKPGRPRFAMDAGGPIIYEIKLDNGSIKQAYIDLSTQYRAEGIQWRDVRTRENWPRHRVVGWREIANVPNQTA